MAKFATNDFDPATADVTAPAEVERPRKRKFRTLRAALAGLVIFTLICGVVYPLVVTAIAKVAFPYEASGSQVIVTMPDGERRVFGSELIGQSYESVEYLFGRVNTGAPSNLSPESDTYRALLKARVEERKQKLAEVGYTESDVPAELVTAGGSGVDPHLSPAAADFQVGAVIKGRQAAGWKLLVLADGEIEPLSPERAAEYEVSDGETLRDYDSDYVKSAIKKYTQGRFLGIFGEKRVNVLLVNLTLDGLL